VSQPARPSQGGRSRELAGLAAQGARADAGNYKDARHLLR